MMQVISLVVPLFGLIFLGYAVGRLKSSPLDGLAWMNFFIVYLALPALFFTLLASTPLSEFANISFLMLATAGTFLTFLLTFIVARVLLRRDTCESTIQALAGAYGNIGYMGPPLAIAALGPEAGVPVALIFCVENIMHFTLAPTLMAIGGARRSGNVFSVMLGVLKSIFTHPFILATIAGLAAAWYQLSLPSAIDQLLQSLAGAAAPCALFVMGVTAALRPLKRVPPELLYLVPVKLVLHPLLVYLLLIQIETLDPLWLQAAVLLATLPTATNVFVIAQHYQVWEQRASSAVVLSTAASVLTVTMYLFVSSAN